MLEALSSLYPQQASYVPPFVPPVGSLNSWTDDSLQRRRDGKKRKLLERLLLLPTPYVGPIGDPFAVGSSSSMGLPCAPSSGFTGNRAEKYLLQIPILDHSKMGKSRMVEVGEWLRFTDVFSAWLALIDESYVNELKLCRAMLQRSIRAPLRLQLQQGARRCFTIFSSALRSGTRGLELLRSVSKRQGSTAAGHETMRFIHANYSIISRMEAVHVRDASLRLYSNCTHLKKPSEIIRHLEDEFSKAEMKLSNFPGLMLKEPDRVSVLLQAIPNEVRQYVVLRGRSGKWDELVDSCRFYEQQLRMVDAASMRQVEQQILCPYCDKKGRAKNDCWKWQRERGGKDDANGKYKGDGKGKDSCKQGYGKGKEKGKHK